MSDIGYPDNWRAFSPPSPAAGTAASISVPAIPNVSHVLTEVIASATWNAGVALAAPAIGIFTNPGGALQKWLLFTEVGVSGAGTSTAIWDGKLLLPPNTGFTIGWQLGEAGVFMWLQLAGYMV